MVSDIAIIGSQYGDEGKGKITYFFANRLYESGEAEAVVKSQGGNNAGHTVIDPRGNVIRLHLLPSGILIPGMKNYVLSEVYVNPLEAMKEIRELESDFGIEITPDNFGISGNCNVTLPYHLDRNAMEEELIGKRVSTRRGIAQTASDKYGYYGIRIADFVDDSFPDILGDSLERNRRILAGCNISVPLEVQSYLDLLSEPRAFLKDFIINEAEIRRNKSGGWVFEQNQGFMLSITYGPQPGNTASDPHRTAYPVDEKLALMKLIPSRVGAAPRIGVMDGPDADICRGKKGEIDSEFGATTGFARDVCYFDPIAITYAMSIIEPDKLVLTKADKMRGVDHKMVVGYNTGEGIINQFPQERALFEACSMHEPLLMDFPRTDEDICGLTEREKLPGEYKETFCMIEDALCRKIDYISTGPKKEHMIER